MSLPIPYHLRGIAEETACTKDTLTLQLRCPCGCTLFRIFQNTLTDEEQAQLQPYTDALAAIASGGYPDFAGMADHMKTGYLRDFHLPERPAFADLKRFTVQCTACDAAAVIFDSRYHGYDGAVCGTEIPPDYEPKMEQIRSASAVRIQLGCTVTPAEFIEITDGMPFTEALFSECFTQIDISAAGSDGRFESIL